MSYVTINPLFSGGGSRSVRVLLGGTPSTPLADGGWVILSRPKRSGFTVWEGYAPHSMELSVMFDGYARDQSQEADIEALRLIMRTPVGPTKQPSPVKLDGPVPMTDTPWVIQTISIDSSSILRRDDGNIVRAAATISLIEYVEADVLISGSPSPVQAVAANAPTTTPQRTHIVVAGDTLSGIASKYLGSWSRYTEIMTLNNIGDARNVKVGTVLRLP